MNDQEREEMHNQILNYYALRYIPDNEHYLVYYEELLEPKHELLEVKNRKIISKHRYVTYMDLIDELDNMSKYYKLTILKGSKDSVYLMESKYVQEGE